MTVCICNLFISLLKARKVVEDTMKNVHPIYNIKVCVLTGDVCTLYICGISSIFAKSSLKTSAPYFPLSVPFLPDFQLINLVITHCKSIANAPNTVALASKMSVAVAKLGLDFTQMSSS